VITQCCISELYANADAAPIALAKTCERRRCGHVPDALSSHDCLTACINISGENKHRYILATQDEGLRGEMRMIPGVPMVYIHRAVMIMEPPSPASLTRRDVLEREKLGGLEGSKRKREGDDGGKPRKKKGPKEPNPLSVKKKKSVQVTPAREPKGGEDGGNKGNLELSEQNVIGEVSDSVRRHKSTRKRKYHKKSSKVETTIPQEAE
jgi:U3 small nucleolar RNA-associated protein 23